MDVVIVGAGIGGLGAALMLGKAGHRVTVLERDPAPPGGADEAWEHWERRGVPQVRLAHVFLSRMRNMIRDDHPELYDALRRAGANEMTWHESMPLTIEDRSPRPVDVDLAMLGVRRPVFEQILRRAASDTGNVEIRSGTAVKGVVAADERCVEGVPHVAGVVLDDGTTIAADLVVDCSGRRSALPQWLDALGARAMPEEEVEDGLMYFGRYYRLEDGRDYPPIPGGPVLDLGYLFGLTFRADDGWFAIALAVHSEDREMRALRDADAFEAALQAIPHMARWRTPGLSRAMTDVSTMARIDDRWRDFVVDGSPVVTGLVALGDSLVATNPALGRGSSLAWIAARELATILGETDDPLELAVRYDDAVRREIRPWFEQTAQMDAQRLEHMRRVLNGEPEPPVDEDDPMTAFTTGFLLAAIVDPDASRAVGHIAGVLKQPTELLGDAELAAKVIAAWEARDSIPTPPAGPGRDELLAAMAAAGSRAAAG